MPPSAVGAIMHSIRRAGSGMSKWRPCISPIVRSASSCIQSRKASPPAIFRAGSASSAATASSTPPPDTMSPATRSISASSRLTSDQPQAYASSRSTAAPRKNREASA